MGSPLPATSFFLHTSLSHHLAVSHLSHSIFEAIHLRFALLVTILSQDLVVRQPPQIEGFEDTQEERDWYGSNPEGIDRDRTSDALYSDEDMGLNQEEDNSDPSNRE